MFRRRYINRRKHLRLRLGFSVVCLGGSGLLAASVATGSGHNKALIVIGATVLLLGWFWGMVVKPPIACAHCGAVGYSDELTPEHPHCPLCGADDFVATGYYVGDATEYSGVVKGIDLVSHKFQVKREQSSDDGGVLFGDSGDGDCGGGGD